MLGLAGSGFGRVNSILVDGVFLMGQKHNIVIELGQNICLHQ